MKMKPISFALNTAQSGIARFTTRKILGSIRTIIISAEKPVQMTVSLASMPDIRLMNETLVMGNVHLPLRCDAVSARRREIERFNFAPQTYDINDSLDFTITGEKNVSVSIEVLYNG